MVEHQTSPQYAEKGGLKQKLSHLKAKLTHKPVSPPAATTTTTTLPVTAPVTAPVMSAPLVGTGVPATATSGTVFSTGSSPIALPTQQPIVSGPAVTTTTTSTVNPALSGVNRLAPPPPPGPMPIDYIPKRTLPSVEEINRLVFEADIPPSSFRTSTSPVYMKDTHHGTTFLERDTLSSTSVTAPSTAATSTTIINEQPVLDRVDVFEHKDIIEKPLIEEHIRQEVIEVHEKPIQKQIVHPTQEVLVREPAQIQSEGYERAELHRQQILNDMIEKDKHRPVQVHENVDYVVHHEQPTVLNVDKQVQKEIITVPIVTEIHEQPIREIHEQEIRKTIYEEPAVYVVRDPGYVETYSTSEPLDRTNLIGGIQGMHISNNIDQRVYQQPHHHHHVPHASGFVTAGTLPTSSTTTSSFTSGSSYPQQFAAPPPPPGPMPTTSGIKTQALGQPSFQTGTAPFTSGTQQSSFIPSSGYSNQNRYQGIMNDLGLKPFGSTTGFQQQQQPFASSFTGNQTSVPPPPPGPMSTDYSRKQL